MVDNAKVMAKGQVAIPPNKITPPANQMLKSTGYAG